MFGGCWTELGFAPPLPPPPELSDFGVPLFGFLFLVCKLQTTELLSALRLLDCGEERNVIDS
jgi:hypothetical protein